MYVYDVLCKICYIKYTYVYIMCYIKYIYLYIMYYIKYICMLYKYICICICIYIMCYIKYTSYRIYALRIRFDVCNYGTSKALDSFVCI
jgi:hypothetical protein